MRSRNKLPLFGALMLLLASAHLEAQCTNNSSSDILPDPYESDDTPDQATPLTIGVAIDPPCQSHSLAPSGDQDWFVYQALDTDYYEIDIYNFNDLILAPQFDIIAQDGVTSLWHQDSNNCVGMDPIVCDTIPPGTCIGTCYLVVYAGDPSQTGNYNVRIWKPSAGAGVYVTGTIQDPQGNPVGGAHVSAKTSPTNTVAQDLLSTKAVQGYTYQMQVSTPNTIYVEATASGYTKATSATIDLPDSTGTPPPVTVNLTMTPLVTASAPDATADSATTTGPTSATLRGSVQTNGASTSASLNYRQGVSGNWMLVSQKTLSNSTTAQSISAPLDSLACGGISYQFEVNASNSGGSTSSSPVTFQTEDCAQPTITAVTPQINCSPPSTCSADLSADVNSTSPPTVVELQYRLSTSSLWSTVGKLTSAASTFSDPFTQAGLRCGASYKFQALAQVQGATSWVYSSSLPFSTPACPGPNVAGLGKQSLAYGYCTAAEISDYSVATSLDIYLKQGAGTSELQKTFSVPANSTSVHKDYFTGTLMCGTNYTVTYTANNANGSDSQSIGIMTPVCTDQIFVDGFNTAINCNL